MAIREILKMGDARLLRVAQPVQEFDTPELHALIADMFDTMKAANGAGLAAPQIGVDLQLVIFGTGEPNPRYPEAPPVPRSWPKTASPPVPSCRRRRPTHLPRRAPPLGRAGRSPSSLRTVRRCRCERSATSRSATSSRKNSSTNSRRA